MSWQVDKKIFFLKIKPSKPKKNIKKLKILFDRMGNNKKAINSIKIFFYSIIYISTSYKYIFEINLSFNLLSSYLI
jgi:hypothetical protein